MSDRVKEDFLRNGQQMIEKWAEESYVKVVSLHIVSEESLDPWTIGPFYIQPGSKHSSIIGPAIVFPEQYISDLYEKASSDIAKLQKVLVWGLAHEFGHHARFLLPGVSKVSSEISASVYAFSFTGQTRRQHNRTFKEIMGMTPSEYVSVKFKQKRGAK